MGANFVARRNDPNTITNRLLRYVQDNPRSSSAEIAQAINEKSSSVASLTTQLHQSGRLIRVPTGLPKGQRQFVFEVGDLDAKTRPQPSKKKQAKLAVADEIAASNAASNAAGEILAKARQVIMRGKINGDHSLSMAESLDASANDDEPGTAPEQPADAYFNEPEAPQEAFKAPVPTPAPQEPATALAVPSVTPREPPNLFPIYRMIESVASTMADEIMYRLNAELTARVSDMTVRLKQEVQMQAPSPEALAARIANAVQPLKKRMPSVLVVGLQPQQAGLISAEFADTFDLRFWAMDESLEMLKHNAKGTDNVITCVSRINHKPTQILESINANIIKVPGGLTQLRNKLTELFVKHADEQPT